MWAAVEADFHREYGVDLSRPGFLRGRSWRWFLARLSNLSPESLTRQQVRKNDQNDPHAAMSALRAASR